MVIRPRHVTARGTTPPMKPGRFLVHHHVSPGIQVRDARRSQDEANGLELQVVKGHRLISSPRIGSRHSTLTGKFTTHIALNKPQLPAVGS